MSEEKQEDRRNEIIIAKKEIRTYLGQCLIDFQRFDELVLSAVDSFVEKMIYIANILKAVGIETDPKYKNAMGKIKLRTEQIELVNENTGRRETRFVHKLGIKKIPDLYMYTDPDSALEVPPMPEEEISGESNK